MEDALPSQSSGLGYRWRVVIGLLGAGLIGIAMSWLFNVAISAGPDLSYTNAWHAVNAATVLWASAPFVSLALIGSRRIAPWLLGLVVTTALWIVGPFLMVYQIESVGVNFGPMWFLLLAPFATGLALIIAADKLCPDAAELSGLEVCAFFGVLGAAVVAAMAPP